MTDHDPTSVMDNTYNGSNIIHYVCKLGNAPILQVCVQLEGRERWDYRHKCAINHIK